MHFRSWGKGIMFLLIGALSAGVFFMRRAGSNQSNEGSRRVRKKNTKNAVDTINPRQRIILEMFKKKDALTNDDISAKIPDVTRRTLRRDLVDLEKKKLIQKKGKTRGAYYVKIR